MAFEIVDQRETIPTNPQDHRIEHVVVHVSGVVDVRTGLAITDDLLAMWYHANRVDWSKRDYHYTIDFDGTITYMVDEGVALPFPTLCSHGGGGYQTTMSVHICLLGWFATERTYTDLLSHIKPIPRTGEKPLPAQIAALTALLADLQHRHALPTTSILAHHELPNGEESCPGAVVKMAAIRSAVAASPAPTERVYIARSKSLQRSQRLARLYTWSNLTLGWLVKLLLPLYVVGISLLVAFAKLPLTVGTLALLPLLLLWPLWRLNWRNDMTTVFMRRALDRFGKDGVQQRWIPLSCVPAHVILLLLTSEDVRFFQHPGVSPRILLRMVRAGLAGRTLTGVSTLTQQMARNIFLWPEKSRARKFIELFLAVLMEMTLSKRRILELYLNLAEMGERLFGLEAASRFYFDKIPGELSFEEAALLMVALHNPIQLKVNAPTPQLLEHQRRLMRAAAQRAKLENEVSRRFHPVSWPECYRPRPAQHLDLDKLLAHFGVTAAEFAPHAAAYFAKLGDLLRKHKLIQRHQTVNSATFAAPVRTFQVRAGLPETGVPDAETLWRLQEPFLQARWVRKVAADVWVRPGEVGYVPARDGYRAFRLRGDAAQRLRGLIAAVHHYGGIVTSAGALRGVDSPTGPGQSVTSMHIAGVAFDLAVPSGMLDPTVDPFIVTRSGDGWQLWSRAEGGVTRELEAVAWADGKVTTSVVEARVVDFTQLARIYGFHPIPPHADFPNSLIDAEWWHFQCEDLLTPWISQYGIEVLRVRKHSRRKIRKSARVWPHRLAVFGRDWF